MTNRKTTKRSLLLSVLSLLLCIAMLTTTTFAWFTDSVTSGKNTIVAGNLDVELEYATFDESGNPIWNPVDANTSLFSAMDGETENLWEPGHTEIVYLKVSNVGTLALTYALGVKIDKETSGTNVAGETFSLSSYLVCAQKVYRADETFSRFENREEVWENVTGGQGIKAATLTGDLLPKEAEDGETFKIIALAVYMPTTVGNEANYLTGTDAPTVELGIKLEATQTPYESDSFDIDYDKNAASSLLSWGDFASDSYTEDQAQKRITVHTAEELAAIAARVNGGDTLAGWTVELADNIDLGGKNWVPIGTNSHPFKGAFDGKGNTISNLTADNPNTWYQGLFGYAHAGAVITDFTLDNVTVNGLHAVSAVCGGAFTAKEISKVNLTGKIEINGNWYVGSIFGYGYISKIEDCHVNAKEGSLVYGSQTYIGGIAGFNGEGNYLIGGCTSNIDVSGYSCVGGIIGILQYQTTVNNCKVEGITVTSTTTATSGRDGNSIGAIAGIYNSSNNLSLLATISNCTGSATLVTNDTINHDGLVGNNFHGEDPGNLVLEGNSVSVTH